MLYPRPIAPIGATSTFAKCPVSSTLLRFMALYGRQSQSDVSSSERTMEKTSSARSERREPCKRVATFWACS